MFFRIFVLYEASGGPKTLQKIKITARVLAFKKTYNICPQDFLFGYNKCFTTRNSKKMRDIFSILQKNGGPKNS